MKMAATFFSQLPSIPYPPAQEGAWSPVTSTIDWCEEVRQVDVKDRGVLLLICTELCSHAVLSRDRQYSHKSSLHVPGSQRHQELFATWTRYCVSCRLHWLPVGWKRKLSLPRDLEM